MCVPPPSMSAPHVPSRLTQASSKQSPNPSGCGVAAGLCGAAKRAAGLQGRAGFSVKSQSGGVGAAAERARRWGSAVEKPAASSS